MINNLASADDSLEKGMISTLFFGLTAIVSISNSKAFNWQAKMRLKIPDK